MRGTPDEPCMSYAQQRAVDILFEDAGPCSAGRTEFDTRHVAIACYVVTIEIHPSERSSTAQCELCASRCAIWTHRSDANHSSRCDQSRLANVCACI